MDVNVKDPASDAFGAAMSVLPDNTPLPFAGIHPHVLGEGPGLIYLYKPPGMSVYPSRRHPERPCLLHGLFSLFPEQRFQDWPDGFAGGILHRLDVSTSGLIAVATSPAAFVSLRRRFTEGMLRKHYQLLSVPIEGGGRRSGEGPWCVDLPIAHHKKNRRKMVWKRGRHSTHRGQWYPAQTDFDQLGRFKDAVLLEATMSTGVMHQIRLHGASLGFPIFGDTLYGGKASIGPSIEADFFLHHVKMDGMPNCPKAPIPESWAAFYPGVDLA